METYTFKNEQAKQINFGKTLLNKKEYCDHLKYSYVKNGYMYFCNGCSILEICLKNSFPEILDGFYDVIKSTKTEAIINGMDIESHYPDVSDLVNIEYENHIDFGEVSRSKDNESAWYSNGINKFFKQCPAYFDLPKIFNTMKSDIFDVVNFNDKIDQVVMFESIGVKYFLMPITIKE